MKSVTLRVGGQGFVDTAGDVGPEFARQRLMKFVPRPRKPTSLNDDTNPPRVNVGWDRLTGLEQGLLGLRRKRLQPPTFPLREIVAPDALKDRFPDAV